LSYVAQYLACALPCERFTYALASNPCITRASAVRYSFTVTDFHRLPFAALPAHPSIHGQSRQTLQRKRISAFGGRAAATQTLHDVAV
jgi:hypothetical protein